MTSSYFIHLFTWRHYGIPVKIRALEADFLDSKSGCATYWPHNFLMSPCLGFRICRVALTLVPTASGYNGEHRGVLRMEAGACKGLLGSLLHSKHHILEPPLWHKGQPWAPPRRIAQFTGRQTQKWIIAT